MQTALNRQNTEGYRGGALYLSSMLSMPQETGNGLLIRLGEVATTSGSTSLGLFQMSYGCLVLFSDFWNR